MKVNNTYQKLKKYIHNTFWIMGERVATLSIGLLMSILLARYLGPVNFGLYSYATSTTALFAAAGHMGLSGLIVREIIKKPEERGQILGTTFGLKLIGMVIGYLILLAYASVFEGVDSINFTVLAVVGATLLFRPFDVIDFWFQAFVQARYIALARLSGLVISSIVKIALIIVGFGLLYLVAANLLQALLVAFGLLGVYKVKAAVKLSNWSLSWKKAKELLRQGWVIYLGSIFAVIYLKIDQVMLRWLLGGKSVGVYAVASQLSEAWYFVPTAIVASYFPNLIKLREQNELLFKQRLQQLFDLLFTLAFVVSIVVTLLADSFIDLFYGSDYKVSADVLIIHIWAAIFIFLRAAFSKWILIENALVFSLLTQGAGAVLNVALNFWLIPIYGEQGAAAATLISYAFASYFSLGVYKKTRPVFYMMSKSVVRVPGYVIGRIFK